MVEPVGSEFDGITMWGEHVSQVGGDSDLGPACVCTVGGVRAQQRDSGACRHLCLKRAAPSGLILKPLNLVPLRKFLVTPLSLHWSGGKVLVNEGVSLCSGP